MIKKKACVTGANGQIGSFLCEYLLSLNYEVVGLVRRSSTDTLWRLKDAKKNQNFSIVEGDITDLSFLWSYIPGQFFDEIYNLAAQSHVASSFTQPIYTNEVNYVGCLNILEVLAKLEQIPTRNKCRFYQASTSEMFGSSYSELKLTHSCPEGPISWKFQNENTTFSPNSPYAISKLAAHNAVRIYREAYGVFAVGGILFNTESCRRGDNFVTQKIAKYLLSSPTKKNKLKLGNISAVRDWNHCKDSVRAIHLLLQNTEPKDYVIGSGKCYTIKDFLREAFGWYNAHWEDWVEIDESCKRPCEVPYLCADSRAIKQDLGWSNTITFKQIVEEMVCETKF